MSDSQRVAIVTDSTADIPPPIAEDHGIDVVPLRVNFGQESFRDGVELTTAQLMERMETAPSLPTTSQPTAGEFAAVFQAAIDAGRDVVCITVGAKLSGTYQAAVTAAEQVGPDRIEIIDGASTTMHIGWPAVAGARVAREGADRATVAQAIRDARARSNLFVALKTLDNVYKGGRIGRAGHLVGAALGIKPIISFREGTLVPLERVRTWKKAMKRMVELVQGEGDLSDIIVLYTDVREDAETLQGQLEELYPDANIILGHAGAVIATHAGPGAIAAATMRRA
jgi:DegV family protein with EDD domain